MEVYLDNAATTKPAPAVLNRMTEILNVYGNPSSLHMKGFLAEQQITRVQKQIGALLGMPYERVIFTSGGTESNNLAILGLCGLSRKRHILTTAIEHASILAVMNYLKQQGFSIGYIPLNKDGTIVLDALKTMITQDTLMVSLAHVNSELGVIQDLAEIGKILKDKEVFFHVDAVQSFGKLPIDCKKWGIDLISVSAHKIHGLKGTGALAVGPAVRHIKSVFLGGGQQQGIRSGTENTPGIFTFGAAIEEIETLMAQHWRHVSKLQEMALAALEKLDGVQVLGNRENPYIFSVCVDGVKGEVLLHALEEKGVFVSTGSACHSKKKESSHVLRALGYSGQALDSVIRISLSRYNTEEEIRFFIDAFSDVLKYLKIRPYEKNKRKRAL